MSENTKPSADFTATLRDGKKTKQKGIPCFPFKALTIVEGPEDIITTGDHQHNCCVELQRVLQILSKKGKSGTTKSAAAKGKVCCQETKHTHSAPAPNSCILRILQSETKL